MPFDDTSQRDYEDENYHLRLVASMVGLERRKWMKEFDSK